MKFNHLNVPTHWQNYWTRYPEGHTILEALISWVSQVDSMVDNQNKLNGNVEQFREEIDAFVERFDERLQTEVTDTLRDWQESGFLDVVISAALQWQLDDYIATNEQDKVSLNEQLAQTAILVSEYGAKGDGVTDDSLAIQVAIEALVEQGGGTLLFDNTNHSYLVNTDIVATIPENVFIRIDGRGATLKRTTTNGGFMLRLFGSEATQLDIQNLSFDGVGVPEQWTELSYTNLNLLQALRIENVTSVVLDHITIENVYGYGMNIRGYDNVELNHITTNRVGGKWKGANPLQYDSFGDSVYLSRANSINSKVIGSHLHLTGYEEGKSLSRIGITFEYDAGIVVLSHIYMEGYERAIHIEACPAIHFTAKEVDINRYGVAFYHMGEGRHLEVDGATVRNSTGAFNTYSGLFTIWQEMSGNFILRNIDLYMNKSFTNRSTPTGKKTLLENITVIYDTEPNMQLTYQLNEFNGLVKGLDADKIYFYFYQPKKVDFHDSVFRKGIDVTESTNKGRALRVTNYAPDFINTHFYDCYVFIENGNLGTQKTTKPLVRNSSFIRSLGFIFTGNDSSVLRMSNTSMYIYNTLFEGNFFAPVSTGVSYIGENNLWIKEDNSIVVL